jgi:hypothetical protein
MNSLYFMDMNFVVLSQRTFLLVSKVVDYKYVNDLMKNNFIADKLKFRWILNLWIDISTKTMNISVPQNIMI